MKLKENLMIEVNKGLEGKNGSIPFPVTKLDEYIDIAKNTNYLIAGDTGSGKSTFAHDLILNLIEWYYANLSDDLKLTIIYFGMERKLYMYSAKWVSRMIYREQGIYIPMKKILGRLRKRDGKGRFTKDYDLVDDAEYALIDEYSDRYNKWEEDDVLICKEGSHNPTGLKKYMEEVIAKKFGTKIAMDKTDPLGKPKYTMHHPNHIVLLITDYVGVLDKEKEDDGKKKSRLDIYSSLMRTCRDLYGFSPVNIQQLNRGVYDTFRLKLNDVKPKLADIADTSELARDADVVVAIFEPFRYLPEDITEDIIGYDLASLKDSRGYKYYRTLHILKNSFEGDDIIMGCAFHPQTGILKSMPKPPKEMTDADYENITSGRYFLS